MIKNFNNTDFKITTCLILIVFITNIILCGNLSFAQDFSIENNILMPTPGLMVGMSCKFDPLIIKGIKLYPQNPLRFDFIIDKGDSSLSDVDKASEAQKLIKYFLTTITIPKQDLWVNLSPYEKDRIIPNEFGITEMGRDLLAQDYLLKQLTASLLYPEGQLGQKFWDRIYSLAYQKFGSTEIPIDTFNKVWIVPEKAVIYENGDMAYIVESKLKVMLEEDYFALQDNKEVESVTDNSLLSDKVLTIDKMLLAKQIIREIMIPEIEKEVNSNSNFSQLRQIYNSIILATWFKKNLLKSVKNSTMPVIQKYYANQNKISGIDVDDKQIKQKIYQKYLSAFKKGVYDYVKEDYDSVNQVIIPRKYFAGGFGFEQIDNAMIVVNSIDEKQLKQRDSFEMVESVLQINPAPKSELPDEDKELNEMMPLLMHEINNGLMFIIYSDVTFKYKESLSSMQKDGLNKIASSIAEDSSMFKRKITELKGEERISQWKDMTKNFVSSVEMFKGMLEGQLVNQEQVFDQLNYVLQIASRGINRTMILERFRINDLIEKSKIRITADSRANIEFIKKIDDEGLIIRADRLRIRQVVINLFKNAVESMPNGGTLTVEVREEKETEQVEIIVSDTGSGMSEDVRQRIFDPYFTTKGENGTGVGLYISKNIIERHGGTINVESELGHGTTFRILLPIKAMEVNPEISNSNLIVNLISNYSGIDVLSGIKNQLAVNPGYGVVNNLDLQEIFVPYFNVRAQRLGLASLGEYYEFLSNNQESVKAREEFSALSKNLMLGLEKTTITTSLLRDINLYRKLFDSSLNDILVNKWENNDLTLNIRNVSSSVGLEIVTMLVLLNQNLRKAYDQLHVSDKFGKISFSEFRQLWKINVDAFDINISNLLHVNEGIYGFDKIKNDIKTFYKNNPDLLKNKTIDELTDEFIETYFDLLPQGVRLKSELTDNVNIRTKFINLADPESLDLLDTDIMSGASIKYDITASMYTLIYFNYDYDTKISILEKMLSSTSDKAIFLFDDIPFAITDGKVADYKVSSMLKHDLLSEESNPDVMLFAGLIQNEEEVNANLGVNRIYDLIEKSLKNASTIPSNSLKAARWAAKRFKRFSGDKWDNLLKGVADTAIVRISENIIRRRKPKDSAMLVFPAAFNDYPEIKSEVNNLVSSLIKDGILTEQHLVIINKFELLSKYIKMFSAKQLSPQTIAQRLYYDSSFIIFYNKMKDVLEKKGFDLSSKSRVFSAKVGAWQDAFAIGLTMHTKAEFYGVDKNESKIELAKNNLVYFKKVFNDKAPLIDIFLRDARTLKESLIKSIDLITIIHPYDLNSQGMPFIMDDNSRLKDLYTMIEGVTSTLKDDGRVVFSLDDYTWGQTDFITLLKTLGFDVMSDLPGTLFADAGMENQSYVNLTYQKRINDHLVIGSKDNLERLTEVLNKFLSIDPSGEKLNLKKLSLFNKDGRNLFIEAILSIDDDTGEFYQLSEIINQIAELLLTEQEHVSLKELEDFVASHERRLSDNSLSDQARVSSNENLSVPFAQEYFQDLITQERGESTYSFAKYLLERGLLRKGDDVMQIGAETSPEPGLILAAMGLRVRSVNKSSLYFRYENGEKKDLQNYIDKEQGIYEIVAPFNYLDMNVAPSSQSVIFIHNVLDYPMDDPLLEYENQKEIIAKIFSDIKEQGFIAGSILDRDKFDYWLNEIKVFALQNNIQIIFPEIIKPNTSFGVPFLIQVESKPENYVFMRDNVNKDDKRVGGIDLTLDKIKIETAGSGIDLNIQIDPAILEQLEETEIQGFSPIIMQIIPSANLPFFLGIKDEGLIIDTEIIAMK